MPPTAAQNVLALSVGLTATMRKQAAKTNAEVSDLIKAHSGDDGVATSAAERQKVYNAILDKYKALAQSWGYSFDKAVEKQNVATAKQTALSLPKGRNHPKPLTADQKVTALNGRTVQKMVAAATQSMGENAVRHLRNAAVAVFNKAKIEGKTDREIQKALAEAWDAEAGDRETHRFVDKSGRSWSNAAYLQMLTRTTLATVHRNAEINTLVGNGCDLARISGDGGGDVCDACQRWEGKVVSLTGATRGFPTLDEAKEDGLFHPNCVHRIEYLDEDEIEEALEASGQKKAAQEAAEEERKEDKLAAKRESAAKARAAKAAKASAEQEETDERKERPEEEATAAVNQLSGFGAAANAIESLSDATASQASIEGLKKMLEDGEATFAKTSGSLPEKLREALKSALESARKVFDDARAGVLDRFGGSAEDVTWARMHKLGIEKEATPMPFKQEGDARGRSSVNPHFTERGPDGYRAAYTENCQRVVSAEELRQRGYAVEALPTFRGDSMPYSNRWADAFEGGRASIVDNIPVGRKTATARTGDKGKAEIERLMQAAGDGARGIVRCGWKGSSCGHVFNVRNDGGNIVFYDAQSGREDASGYFSQMSQTGLRFLRVDNLAISKKIVDYIRKKR